MTYLLRPGRLAQRLPLSTNIRQPAARQTIHTTIPKTQSARPCLLCRMQSQPRRDDLYRHPAQSPHSRSLSTTRSLSAESNNNDSNDNIPNAPDVTNHYTIFRQTLPAGPPPASPFNIPLPALRREFLTLQSQAHPDKYPPGPAKQRAEALSARLNEAHRTLVDPLQRAQYLLREMHGIDVTAEDGAAKHALDPETLMEVMGVQEAIEEVAGEPAAKAEEVVERMKGENEARVENCVGELAAAFDAGEIEKARKECVRLRFWYSVGEGLKEWTPGTSEIRLVH